MTTPDYAAVRPLGNSNIYVSPVSLGTWPMAGVTSLNVNGEDNIATLQACLELGINFIDSAYCYGPNGESENFVRQALAERRDEMVLATKCGMTRTAEGRIQGFVWTKADLYEPQLKRI